MAQIPDAVRDKLNEPHFWHLVTLNEDGTAASTPVWAHVDGDDVIVNTALGRVKEQNVRRDPRVTLSMHENDNPYSWIEIRGKVRELVEGQPAEDSIDALAKKYLNQDVYPFRQPGERRVILRIEPLSVIVPSH